LPPALRAGAGALKYYPEPKTKPGKIPFYRAEKGAYRAEPADAEQRTEPPEQGKPGACIIARPDGKEKDFFNMNRKQAAEEAKSRPLELLPIFTDKAKATVNGRPTFICPLCRNGSGSDGDGITINPKSKSRTGLKCFKCGFSGSIIDLVMQAGGYDYNMAVEICADALHIPLEDEKGPFEAGTGTRDKKTDREEKTPKRAEFSGHAGTTAAPQGTAGALDEIQNPFTLSDEEIEAEINADIALHNDLMNSDPDYRRETEEAAREFSAGNTAAATEKAGEPADGGADPGQLADYTAFYKECAAHLDDAKEYLQGRGISKATAAAYSIGFCREWISPTTEKRQKEKGSEWRPEPSARVIVPVTKSHYLARAIDDEHTPKQYRKMNETGGGQVGIFNLAALYSGAAVVFITEGAFSALSIIEAGGAALALNSTSNADILLQALKAKPTAATLAISTDNDESGERAKKALLDGLQALQIQAEPANVAGTYNDPNDALQAERQAFIDRVKGKIAEIEDKAAQRAGLLTAGRARQILAEADDTFLTLPRFPELAKTVKIKRHDTIALAADTGAGKSSLALNFLHELNDRHPVIYFNLEMDESTIIQRLVAIHTGIDLDRIEGYKQDENTREKVNAAIDEITGRQEIRLLNDVYSLEEIEKQIKAATAGREDPTIVFIDTGLLVTTGTKTGSRYERFTLISEEMRRISRLNNIVLFVLLQMNRDGKADQKKPPTNSSLKESGSWENDATKILFLWDNPETGKDRKEIIITKNRSGKTGTFTLNYSAHTQTYSEPGGAFLPDDGQAPFNQDADGWTTYTGSGEPATPGNSGRVRY